MTKNKLNDQKWPKHASFSFRRAANWTKNVEESYRASSKKSRYKTSQSKCEQVCYFFLFNSTSRNF